ncbi:PPOX class F420-dependent oxidoreductase [Ktedonosporobacter rubrisoli]|uniref:PPOX class F420-dependent oxidoreductase n=1 Tax=Ktedonosporobacter rubrisoli TaxID=2509675 RepID=A0A4P6JRN4_KTERU|nr:PPOX class F420-dependent oxidoreductase [Ktedonosporobacter rubrisoli]QBD77955.1 PPOX class F420-dependent oxidoreductase [Ktedonosporobacter rubrisoli]
MSSILSAKARAFLEEKRFAVLATINADGTPQLTTMWYLLEGDTIVMNTKVGRLKDRNMRRDPRVSVCFEDGYSYLTISGKIEFVEDQQIAQEDIRRLAIRYHGEQEANKQAQEQYSKETRVTLRLKCEHIIDDLG